MFHPMESSSAITAIERLMDATVAKRLDEIIDSYEPSEAVFVFLEGPRWATHGFAAVATGWTAFIDADFQVRSRRWIGAPELIGEGGLASIQGIFELDTRVGDIDRTVRFRGTWTLRKSTDETDGKWRIVHEHVSMPAEDPYGIGDWLSREPVER